jgi:hypothetical protein
MELRRASSGIASRSNQSINEERAPCGKVEIHFGGYGGGDGVGGGSVVCDFRSSSSENSKDEKRSFSQNSISGQHLSMTGGGS